MKINKYKLKLRPNHGNFQPGLVINKINKQQNQFIINWIDIKNFDLLLYMHSELSKLNFRLGKLSYFGIKELKNIFLPIPLRFNLSFFYANFFYLKSNSNIIWKWHIFAIIFFKKKLNLSKLLCILILFHKTTFSNLNF